MSLRLNCSPEDPRSDRCRKSLLLVLQALLELRCAEHDVGTNLVALHSELKELVLGERAGVRALRGWRAEVFGTDAIALLEGRLVLTGGVEGGRMRAVTARG